MPAEAGAGFGLGRFLLESLLYYPVRQRGACISVVPASAAPMCIAVLQKGEQVARRAAPGLGGAAQRADLFGNVMA